MKYLPAIVLFGLLLGLSACSKNDITDRTINIVGVYEGDVALYLDTDSTRDFTNQRVEIRKVDDNRVQILMLEYPDESPADTLEFFAELTPTPLGFIRTKGVLLTIGSTSYAEGVVKGVPYLGAAGGLDEHGLHDEESGELVFALEVLINGVNNFELFQGRKQ